MDTPPASDTPPESLGSPVCVARLLLLASDATLMSGGDQARGRGVGGRSRGRVRIRVVGPDAGLIAATRRGVRLRLQLITLAYYGSP